MSEQRDIRDAIALARVAFRRCDLSGPSAIHLPTHEDGQRFMSLLRSGGPPIPAIVGDPASFGAATEMADGSVYMSVEVMGLKVMWPANRYATPDGSWRYI